MKKVNETSLFIPLAKRGWPNANLSLVNKLGGAWRVKEKPALIGQPAGSAREREETPVPAEQEKEEEKPASGPALHERKCRSNSQS